MDKYNALKLAKESMLIPFDIEKEDNYRCHVKQCVKDKLCDIIRNTLPLLSVTFDGLVERDDYERYAVSTVGHYGKTPHELNLARVEALEKARKNMHDIPFQGYDRYAIVQFVYNANRDDLSISRLMGIVSDSHFRFLWFTDGNTDGEDFGMPTIEW